MTRFQGGPAGGVVLMLRRSPLFLRAVCGRGQSDAWDALDLLTDTPEADEVIVAYRRASKDGVVHIDVSRPGRGYWFSCATYEHVEPQPDDETLRDTAKWREWCQSQMKPKDNTGGG